MLKFVDSGTHLNDKNALNLIFAKLSMMVDSTVFFNDEYEFCGQFWPRNTFPEKIFEIPFGADFWEPCAFSESEPDRFRP